MTKFFLDQRGCAKNQVDGEIIISHLLSLGWEQSLEASQADLIIINSCGFIESAKKESLAALMGARKKFKDKKIILAGCLAERYAKIFKDALPEADGIFGNGDLSRISLLAKKVIKGKRAVDTPPQKGISCGERLKLLSYKNSAYVKITEGCSNHCSFCAIPLIRGELRSRKAADIIKEIRSLLKRGIFEINLIGQDLAAYGLGADDDVFARAPKEGRKKAGAKKSGPSPLSRLLKKISSINGDFWIRLLYIHPDHFNSDILQVLKNDRRILPYFDIPFQSGDDKIILAMNRKNSAKNYISLAKEIRKEFPDAALRTTFLAGFPGEGYEEAENSLAFLKEIQPDWSGAFAYSKEDDTPAFSFKKQVPKKVSAKRAAALQEAQEKITQERLAFRVRKNGKNLEYKVLIEEIVDNPEDESFAIGRAWFQAPEVDGNFVIQFDPSQEKSKAVKEGALVKVRALAVSGVDIYAELI